MTNPGRDTLTGANPGNTISVKPMRPNAKQNQDGLDAADCAPAGLNGAAPVQTRVINTNFQSANLIIAKLLGNFLPSLTKVADATLASAPCSDTEETSPWYLTEAVFDIDANVVKDFFRRLSLSNSAIAVTRSATGFCRYFYLTGTAIRNDSYPFETTLPTTTCGNICSKGSSGILTDYLWLSSSAPSDEVSLSSTTITGTGRGTYAISPIYML